MKLSHITQVDVNTTVSDMPSEQEIITSIQLLSCGKAPRPDAIPREIYRLCGQTMILKLTEPFQAMWTADNIP